MNNNICLINLGAFRPSKIELHLSVELLIENSFQLAIIAHQLSVTCCDIAPLQGQYFHSSGVYIQLNQKLFYGFIITYLHIFIYTDL